MNIRNARQILDRAEAHFRAQRDAPTMGLLPTVNRLSAADLRDAIHLIERVDWLNDAEAQKLRALLHRAGAPPEVTGQ